VPEQYGDAMAVTDEAISRIKQMIISGELAPGDRLPPEKELSENLGLSRSSMREAIKALEGTYVTSLDARLLIEAISFVMELQSDIQIIETLVVRRICEGAAVGMAAARITPDQIASLRQFIEDSLPTGSVEELVAHDLEFHARIVASSGNSYLAALVESLSSKTVRARIWRGITQSNAVGRTLEEHRSIVDALATGDAKLAESLTVAHIAGVEHWLRENIG
jgi:GntR family transcriptional repressor for pyruvate dehydrogenase complex